MNAVQLATWRDAAVILLAAQAMVLGLVLAAGLYWSLRGVRRLNQWIRPILFETRLRVWGARQTSERALRTVAAPFVWVHSAVTGLLRALEMLGWR